MKKYEECQKFDNISHLPAEGLHNVMAPWPFVNLGSRYSWTFSLVKGQVKFLLVGIDHFRKWIEVKPVVTISIANIHKFIWKNVVCKFKILNTLIFDNVKQFINKEVEEFLINLGIKHRATLVEHQE